MKSKSLLAGFLLAVWSLAAPAALAELVHLKFLADEQSIRFRPDVPAEPWNSAWLGSDPLQLDIFYNLDPTASQNPSPGEYLFTDLSDAFWRVRAGVLFPVPNLPPLEIIRPINRIGVGPTSMSFYYYDPDRFEEFEFYLGFEAPLVTESGLPVPPMPDLRISPYGPPYFWADGLETLFNIPVEGEGRIDASFTSFEAEILGQFPPIPEPSTYGLFGAALLGLVAITRRRARAIVRGQSACPP